MIENLTKAKTFNDVSEYVQENARYHEDAPKFKYSCKYPHLYGSRSVFSADTYNLAEQLAKIYNIRKTRS